MMKNKHLKTSLLFAYFCILSFLYYIHILPSIVFVLIVLIISWKLLKMSIDELGIKLRNIKKTLIYSFFLILLNIPIMIYASTLPEFREFYPMNPSAELNTKNFIEWELILLPEFLALEIFFRGVMLFNLGKYSGKYAILLQTIPYSLLHFGKPKIEIYYSFFAGLVDGYVCWKCKSFMPGFLSHYSTSVIFDILCLG